MTYAETCLLMAGILPYVAAGLAKSDATYDNKLPRAWLAQQTGWRARANAAQANSFEALAFFAAAVLCAQGHHGNQLSVDRLAVLFILARIAYLICYVADWAALRSWAWMVGIGCVISLFFV